MTDGGILTIRTKHIETIPGIANKNESPFVAVEVSDTGVGMDGDTRRRCLEPFFTTKGERGTGLCLAMVYGMVQRHSAEIEIESVAGSGTTVRCLLAALNPLKNCSKIVSLGSQKKAFPINRESFFNARSSLRLSYQYYCAFLNWLDNDLQQKLSLQRAKRV